MAVARLRKTLQSRAARIGFSVTASNVRYYLTKLRLQPHETRAIDLRKLRDAQSAGFKQHQIPASATDGAVNWVRIDNVPVEGHIVVVGRGTGMTSSYNLSACPCPASYAGLLEVSPLSFEVAIDFTFYLDATATLVDCNGIDYYYNVTDSSTWSSGDTTIATVGNTGGVLGLANGTATIGGVYQGTRWHYTLNVGCEAFPSSGSANSSANVGPHPVNFRLTWGGAVGAGELEFNYAWDSSTGNLADLGLCVIYEVVNYPGGLSPYVWPKPPWDYSTNNPIVNDVPGTDGMFIDIIYPGTFLRPYQYGSFSSTQYYRYTCNGGNEVTLQGPITNTRTVQQNAGGSTFEYIVSTRGYTNTINPLP